MKTPEEIKKGLETCIGKCTGNKPHCPYHYCGDGCMDSMNRDALALIQQLEEQVPKWISVEERLPEVDGKYIVCTAKRSVYFTRFYAQGKGGTGTFQTDIYTHITHWMPLPEPPKEEE